MTSTKDKIARINGWMSSDGTLFKTEEEAVEQENYLAVYHKLMDIMNRDSTIRSGHAVAYILAQNRKELYEILKDNV